MYSKNLFNKKQKRNGVIAFGMISSAGKFTKISLSVVIIQKVVGMIPVVIIRIREALNLLVPESN